MGRPEGEFLLTSGSAQMTHLFLLLRAATYKGSSGCFLCQRLGLYLFPKAAFSSICEKRRCDMMTESCAWILACFLGYLTHAIWTVGRGGAGLICVWSLQLLLLTECLNSRDFPGLSGLVEASVARPAGGSGNTQAMEGTR